jgi:hypothetical protein
VTVIQNNTVVAAYNGWASLGSFERLAKTGAPGR